MVPSAADTPANGRPARVGAANFPGTRRTARSKTLAALADSHREMRIANRRRGFSTGTRDNRRSLSKPKNYALHQPRVYSTGSSTTRSHLRCPQRSTIICQYTICSHIRQRSTRAYGSVACHIACSPSSCLADPPGAPTTPESSAAHRLDIRFLDIDAATVSSISSHYTYIFINGTFWCATQNFQTPSLMLRQMSPLKVNCA